MVFSPGTVTQYVHITAARTLFRQPPVPMGRDKRLLIVVAAEQDGR